MTALPASFLETPIAHRGLHDRAAGRPENGIEAFEAAIAAGYGIELDIQPSSDGVPMVFHDHMLDRMTDASGPITARTAEELGALRLTRSFETVPTLARVLAQVAGRVPLLVEIKDQDGALGPDVGPLERAVAGVLAGYQGPVAVMSFNPESVAAFGEAAPGIPRGITTEAYIGKPGKGIPPARRKRLHAIADFDRVGASFISHDHEDLTRAPVQALRARGVPILCWTIRSEKHEAEARRHADNITFEGYPAAIPAS